MQIFTRNYIYHFIGGFASGSFICHLKNVKKMALGKFLDRWWFIFLVDRTSIAASLTLPGFSEIIRQTPGSIIFYTMLFECSGAFGGLTYGLGSTISWYVPG